MLTAWRRWCRLCAKQDGDEVNIFVKNENILDLPDAIQKFFLITISPYDEAPTMICTNCYSFLIDLINFATRASKVEAMFAELMFDKFNMVSMDLNCLRYQYGLDKNINESKKTYNKCVDTSDLMIEYLQIAEEDADDSEMYTVYVNSSSNEEQEHSEESSSKSLEKDNVTTVYADPLMNGLKSEKEVDNINTEEIEVEELDETFNREDNTYDADYAEEEYLDIKTEQHESEEEMQEQKPIVRVKIAKSQRKCEERFKCEICNKEFLREGTYKHHVKVCQPEKEARYCCTKCDKTFPTEKRAQQHEAIHLPRELKALYPCRFCDKKFTKAVNVQAHVKAIHIGEKPFICEECGKTFGTKGALKEHKYIHIDETPYQCSRCDKKFKNMARLKTHEDTHNDTMYVCPHCGLQLNTKRTLQMHMVVHSDQKKFKCNYCGNEYKRSKGLKNHLILHTGLRPYTCPFCDKTFANGSNCRSHKKKAHPIELAAMEAAGEKHPVTNIPKLEQLKAVAEKIVIPPLSMKDSQESHNKSEEHADLSQLNLNSNLISSPATSDNSSTLQQSMNGLQRPYLISNQPLQQLHQEQEEQQRFHSHNFFDSIEVSLNT